MPWILNPCMIYWMIVNHWMTRWISLNDWLGQWMSMDQLMSHCMFWSRCMSLDDWMNSNSGAPELFSIRQGIVDCLWIILLDYLELEWAQLWYLASYQWTCVFCLDQSEHRGNCRMFCLCTF